MKPSRAVTVFLKLKVWWPFLFIFTQSARLKRKNIYFIMKVHEENDKTINTMERFDEK